MCMPRRTEPRRAAALHRTAWQPCLQGEQIADMFACCADDSSELLSAGATRGAAQRLFPRVGGAFFSNRFRSLLTFVADRSPGVHDMLWRPCDSHLYALAGAQLPHPSCTDNFRRLAAEFGWTPEEVWCGAVCMRAIETPEQAPECTSATGCAGAGSRPRRLVSEHARRCERRRR